MIIRFVLVGLCLGLGIWGIYEYLFGYPSYAADDLGASAWLPAIFFLVLLIALNCASLYRLWHHESQATRIQTITTGLFVFLVLLTIVSLGAYLLWASLVSIVIWFISRRKKHGILL
jgi:hypothetical protein